MAGLPIEAVGADVASKHLRDLARRGGDPRPAFREIIEELREGEARLFASHPWPPLAETTKARKSRLGQPLDPLVATGALERSLTVKRGKGALRSATKTRMRFGTKVYYGRFHEFGEGVPKRQILVETDVRTRRRMVKSVSDWMMGRSRGAPE